MWSPSVLGPTPRMRLTEADRSGGIKPDHTLLWSGSVRLDTGQPGWLCKHRRQRRGIRDNPTCGKDRRTLNLPRHHLMCVPCRRVCVAKWTLFTPQGCCPGSLVAVGGRSQAGRAGGVKPGVSAVQQQ